MKTICFMRHGTAEKIKSEGTDYSRHLTDKGKKESKKILKSIKNETSFNCDVIITSVALRAVETASIAAKKFGFSKEDIIINEYLYQNVNMITFKSIFNKIDNSIQSIMLIGHNPILSEIVSRFFPDFSHEMPASSAVSIDFETDDWNKIFECGKNLKFYKFMKSSKLTKFDEKLKKNILTKFENEVTSLVEQSKDEITFSDLSKIDKNSKKFINIFSKQIDVITINDVKILSGIKEELELKILQKAESKIQKANEKKEIVKNKYEQENLKLEKKENKFIEIRKSLDKKNDLEE